MIWLVVLIDLHYWEPILDQLWIHSVPAMLELPPDQFTMILSQQNNCILLLDEIHRSVLHESTAPQVAADRVAILSRCDSALLRSLIPAAPMISLSDDSALKPPKFSNLFIFVLTTDFYSCLKKRTMHLSTISI
jgi:hypothetical protein